MSIEDVTGLYNYWIVIFLMMTGFYIVLARQNLIKTIIGLNIFQTSVFLLYITMGKVRGGTAPIIPPHLAATNAHSDAHGTENHAAEHHVSEHAETVEETIGHVAQQAAAQGEALAEPIYSNPLPSVLMLTAIVVGISTTALALALIVRLREEYGTIEENEILELDHNS